MNEEIEQVRRSADCLYDRDAIETALDRMAEEISAKLGHANPLLLTVMNGGMMPAGMLLARLDFPLEVDYIHLSRYGDKTSGGEIRWIREPQNIQGREVLIIDDLLDQGVTLQKAVARCEQNGAARVYTAVLVVKDIADRQGLQHTDFYGLETPDRYLFGMGMDYKHYWRNAFAIYAVAGL